MSAFNKIRHAHLTLMVPCIWWLTTNLLFAPIFVMINKPRRLCTSKEHLHQSITGQIKVAVPFPRTSFEIFILLGLRTSFLIIGFLTLLWLSCLTILNALDIAAIFLLVRLLLYRPDHGDVAAQLIDIGEVQPYRIIEKLKPGTFAWQILDLELSPVSRSERAPERIEFINKRSSSLMDWKGWKFWEAYLDIESVESSESISNPYQTWMHSLPLSVPPTLSNSSNSPVTLSSPSVKPNSSVSSRKGATILPRKEFVAKATSGRVDVTVSSPQGSWWRLRTSRLVKDTERLVNNEYQINFNRMTI